MKIKVLTEMMERLVSEAKRTLTHTGVSGNTGRERVRRDLYVVLGQNVARRFISLRGYNVDLLLS